MASCSQCDRDEVPLSSCDLCGGQYCADHRSPYAHGCVGLMMLEETDDTTDSETTTGLAATLSDVAIPRPSFESVQTRIESVIGRISSSVVVTVVLVLVVALSVGSTALLVSDFVGRTNALGVSPSDIFDTGNQARTSSPAVKAADLNRSAVTRLVHEEVNQRRADRGLPPLEYDPTLAEIARYHSKDMAEREYVGHESPTGETLRDRYAMFEYECELHSQNGTRYTGGEIVLYTFYNRSIQTAEGVEEYHTPEELATGIVRSLMSTDAHRNVILSNVWETEGIGIYITDDNKVLVTQNFC